jgi:hypothetical protein
MAHACRKFVDALNNDEPPATYALQKIQKYMLLKDPAGRRSSMQTRLKK